MTIENSEEKRLVLKMGWWEGKKKKSTQVADVARDVWRMRIHE